MENTLIAIVIIVLIASLVFRELACWYWKINEVVGLQKKQNNMLEEIRDLMKAERGARSSEDVNFTYEVGKDGKARSSEDEFEAWERGKDK